ISSKARKEQSPNSTTPKVETKLKMDDLASENKGSRTSSLKKVRTLTKTTNFMPSRPLKTVILGEDLDAQRATCSLTNTEELNEAMEEKSMNNEDDAENRTSFDEASEVNQM
nr:plant calmodulin-binding protein-related, putative isoform 1 [Tanacetum cinerariifolium]